MTCTQSAARIEPFPTAKSERDHPRLTGSVGDLRTCNCRRSPRPVSIPFVLDPYCARTIMADEIFYRSFLNRDRIVHIVDPDLQTCESLSVVFRLEGFQTAFSVNLEGF